MKTKNAPARKATRQPKSELDTVLGMLPEPTIADIIEVMQTDIDAWDGEMMHGPHNTELQILLDIKALRAGIALLRSLDRPLKRSARPIAA